MCHRSAAAVTLVKYECDSRNLTCTFARSKILLTEKLTNGALVTPTPGSDNNLSPVCHKAVIRTIVDLLPNKPMGKFREMGFEVHKLLFEKKPCNAVQNLSFSVWQESASMGVPFI